MFVNINLDSECGNYWSSPKIYFNDFKNTPTVDLSDLESNKDSNFIIFNGSGVTKKEIEKINLFHENQPNIKMISWGLGFNFFDHSEEKTIIGDFKKLMGLKNNFFKDFNLLGLRDFGMKFDYDWVPCASCLHPYFQKYKKIPSKKKIGVFYDKNIFKIRGVDFDDYMSNEGYDIESKLSFIANFEYILTNSHYGVFWAQLLNRKVICMPVKYSLINFRYKPFFLVPKFFRIAEFDDTIKLDKSIFDMCENTPDFLNESIESNYKFFKKVKNYL